MIYFAVFSRNPDQTWCVVCILEPLPGYEKSIFDAARRQYRIGHADRVTVGHMVNGKFDPSSERIILNR